MTFCRETRVFNIKRIYASQSYYLQRMGRSILAYYISMWAVFSGTCYVHVKRVWDQTKVAIKLLGTVVASFPFAKGCVKKAIKFKSPSVSILFAGAVWSWADWVGCVVSTVGRHQYTRFPGGWTLHSYANLMRCVNTASELAWTCPSSTCVYLRHHISDFRIDSV